MKHSLATIVLLVAGGCPGKDSRRADQPPADARVSSEATEAQSREDDAQGGANPHSVVFADRTSQGYLLLVEGERPEAITREALQALVRRALTSAEDEPELELLLTLIAMEPSTAPRTLEERVAPSDATPPDLLGLHIDVLPVHGPEGSLIAPDLFADPILTRALDPQQRASLARRRWAILLRADYRNQHAVRGLRLLQTLVRLVAAERGALVHEPDTGETLDEHTFTARRLRSTIGNIADQVAVVPFPDPVHQNQVRLSTRGMRKFGSVDLELTGLPLQPELLQRATLLIHGLAYQMVRLGEYDVSGYSVELDEVVTIRHEDVAQAYANHETPLSRCESCPARVDVHLVERAPEPHDPPDHVVARIVAPRSLSDEAAYDHAAWVEEALGKLLGR